jgi:hypothetical protein
MAMVIENRSRHLPWLWLLRFVLGYAEQPLNAYEEVPFIFPNVS